MNFLPTVPVSKIAKDGGADEFDNNVKSNNYRIFKVLNIVLLLDIESLLKEHWLQGIHTNKNERKHEVMKQATNKIFLLDTLIEIDAVKASVHLFNNKQNII